MAAWFPQPVMFDSSHSFDCEGFNEEQCRYYKEHWRNWYIADWAYALPMVAFFISIIGIFIIANVLSQVFALSGRREPLSWRRGLAATRYLSYRGFHVPSLGWNSAPIGVLLLGAVGTIYFFCMDLVPSPYYWPGTDIVWGNSPPLGTRSGWLALACMPFLFATARKTNWITLVTGITHEKLQLFHRWIAYAFFILALMHTFPFIVWHMRNHDMAEQFNVTNTFEYWTGVVALLFQAWLTAASWGPIRALGYEFFKAAHYLSAVVFMLALFCRNGSGLCALLDISLGKNPFEYGGQKAEIFVEDNGFTRITIPASFNWRPGQHCFLRFPSFGIHALTSHPFTICSLPSMSAGNPSKITFYIRHRGGFTTKLYNLAAKHSNVRIPVFVDGPYGGIDNEKYFGSDRLVVVAGGAGAGWSLPLIEQYLRHRSSVDSSISPSNENTEKHHSVQEKTPNPELCRPHSLRVILVTRDIATRKWFYSAVNGLIAEAKMLNLQSELSVEVNLTGAAESILSASTKTTHDLENQDTSSAGEESTKEGLATLRQHGVLEQELLGRPDLPRIIREEAATTADAGHSVGVFVCGPLSMQDDVRNAVAEQNWRIMKRPNPAGCIFTSNTSRGHSWKVEDPPALHSPILATPMC